jgi:heme exporter protein CcmD
MPDLGNHAGFVLAAFVFAALILAGLAGWAVLDHRAQLAALDRLERAGARRRSTRGDNRPGAAG